MRRIMAMTTACVLVAGGGALDVPGAGAAPTPARSALVALPSRLGQPVPGNPCGGEPYVDTRGDAAADIEQIRFMSDCSTWSVVVRFTDAAALARASAVSVQADADLDTRTGCGGADVIALVGLVPLTRPDATYAMRGCDADQWMEIGDVRSTRLDSRTVRVDFRLAPVTHVGFRFVVVAHPLDEPRGDAAPNSTWMPAFIVPGAVQPYESLTEETTIHWSRPTTDRRLRLTGYVLQREVDGRWRTVRRFERDTRRFDFGDVLPTGVPNRLRLAATNDQGRGPWSFVTVRYYEAPGQATNIQHVVDGDSVTVTFAAPADTGGYPLDRLTYPVQITRPDGRTPMMCKGNQSLRCRISGLAPGTYSFVVIASNPQGSTRSASSTFAIEAA